jgi:hypothetical protein
VHVSTLHRHWDSVSDSRAHNTPSATARTLVPGPGAGWLGGSVPWRMAVAVLSRSSRPVSSGSGDVSASVSLPINSASFAAAASACSSTAALWVLLRSYWALPRRHLRSSRPCCVACGRCSSHVLPVRGPTATKNCADPSLVFFGLLGQRCSSTRRGHSSFCCVCLPHPSCAPPSYCEHALVSPQRCRTAALANSFSSGPAIPSFLVRSR